MRKMMFLAAIALAAVQALAGNVDLMTAQSKARAFLTSKASKGRLMTSAPTVKWTHEVKNSSNASQAALYIVNTDKGYAIVAGDDRVSNVLAYGEGSLESVNNLPESMQFFLEMYQAEVEYIQAHPGMIVKNHNRSGISVAPLLQTLWNQGSTSGRSPYNKLCPQTNGMYCLVGCAAISLGQVMKFWEYPEGSPALPGYTGEAFGVTVPDLPAYTFDWPNMRNTYKNDNWSEAEAAAISHFLRYVGQAEGMDYGTNMSGADEDCMLRAIRLFGYDPGAHYVLKNDYDYDMTELVSDEDWINMMQAELVAGRPLMYCAGASMSDGSAFYGHAFNVDGYDAENDMYHVNFGQSEDKNGYYAFNAFGYGITVYKYFQLMFVGMQPPTGPAVPRIVVGTPSLAMECYAGESTTATFNVTGLDLTGDITLTVNDENGVFTTDVATISATDASNKTITVTYAPQAVGNHAATITLTSEGAEPVTVALNGTATTAPLVVYKPVMLPAAEDYITATSFRADWTDQTAAENVVSYTLEVSEKPNTNVLDEIDWSELPKVNGNQAGNAPNYLPEGWGYSGYDFYLDGGNVQIGTDDYIKSKTYNLAGYDKVTVVVRAKNYYSWKNASIIISTTVDAATVEMSGDYVDYTVVLNCADNDYVTFTGGSAVYIQGIKIYAGENEGSKLNATRDGEAFYRLITGITGKFCNVDNLPAQGTYLYKVKALYTDNTESAWSNTEMVTLFGPAYENGDVNHDGNIDVADVTALVSYLLTGSGENFYLDVANVNGEDEIDVADVTALITLVLGN